MNYRTLLIAFCLVLFCSSLTWAQQPVENDNVPDIPEISLDEIDWADLEVSYQSEEVEREPWHNKIDGKARLQQRKYQILQRNAEQRGRAVDERVPEKMEIIIRVTSSDARQQLEEAGFELTREINHILVGRIPFDHLEEAAVIDEVSYIEATPQAELQHEESIPNINADQVHAGEGGLDMPYRGEDVIVGIVDSGIDFTHPDFNTEEGTRIQYLREYRDPNEFTPEIIVWDSDDIDENPDEVTQVDGQQGGGHGTHVAGTAAGGGKVDPAMRGVAPEADIIAVNASRNPQSSRSFSFNDIIDGTAFIFEKADEMGKPAVVNLSLGSPAGPRDGTTTLEEAFNELTGPGNIIVSSSGNSGFEPGHIGADLEPNTRFMAPVIANENEDEVSIEAWFDRGTLSEFKLIGLQRSDDNLEIMGQTDWLRPGEEMDDEIEISRDGQTLGYLIADASVTNADINGDSQFTAEIFSEDIGTDLTNTKWIFVANSTINGGRFDMYVNSGGFFYPNETRVSRVRQLIGDNEQTISLPSSASELISVGAHTARSSWVTEDEFCPFNVPEGEECRLQLQVPTNPLDPDQSRGPNVGELAYFSSVGPLRDGEQAPDVTAPGFMVMSTLSSDFRPPEGALPFVRKGGRYIINNGTSMAAPHVAGAVALMLQVNPNLTSDNVRGILEFSSAQDNHTGNVPNNEFGYGKLDVLAALVEEPVFAGSEENPEEAELTNYPNPFNPVTTVQFSLPESDQVSISIYNSIGQVVKRIAVDEQMEAGTHEVEFDGSGLSSGVYLLRLEAGGDQITQQMTLIK